MYDTILFPTDGSDPSFDALDNALDLAESYGATLHALYVVDTTYPYGDFDGSAIDPGPLFDALREEGERTLERIEGRADDAGIPFVGAIRESGSIHRSIIDYADEEGVDLIVMGTHGRRGLNRWLLGSVTERVVRTADVPVLTVRAEREPEE